MPSSSSRIVFAEDLVGAALWQPGVLECERRSGRDRRARGRRHSDDEPDAAPAPGYDDGVRDGLVRGIEQGVAQGLEQARRESADAQRAQIEAIAARADALVASLTAQLARLQQSLADEVVTLAVEIARSAVGATLKLRAEIVAPVVADALAALVDEHGRPVLRVNPEDATLLGEHLEPLLAARGATLVPDPTVSPGGCVAETSRASVDATIQTRWRRAIAAIGRDDEWVQT
jgi:flagellar assembly protein FliH